MIQDYVPVEFFPALWMQRRSLASKILLDFNFTHVFDMGCGEGALLEILINSTHFTQLSGLDITEECISQANFACVPSSYHQRFYNSIDGLYKGF
jgi:trans-aconitate methyltransferase